MFPLEEAEQLLSVIYQQSWMSPQISSSRYLIFPSLSHLSPGVLGSWPSDTFLCSPRRCRRLWEDFPSQRDHIDGAGGWKRHLFAGGLESNCSGRQERGDLG